MNILRDLWKKLRVKKYREEFVAAQVKRGIPFQVQTLMKQKGYSQEKLAEASGLTQGVISRAANPDYGNLTLNTIIKIAAGFDVAFIGKFVPFSELGNWFTGLSEESVKSFKEEDAEMSNALGLGSAVIEFETEQQSPARDQGMGRIVPDPERAMAAD
jgi:transcriptional regulator with XRE-family HTH domain